MRTFDFDIDWRADTSPMLMPMCALCTHDVLPGEQRYRWSNGAIAHSGRRC